MAYLTQAEISAIVGRKVEGYELLLCQKVAAAAGPDAREAVAEVIAERDDQEARA